MANISNTNSNTLISGTNFDDSILTNSHHVTVKAGKGNDIVEFENGSSRSVYQYSNGDGDDTIIGFDNFTEGVISLTGNTVISNYQIDSNNNHILKIGKGSITLKNTNIDKVSVKTKNKNYRYINGRAFNDPSFNGNNFYTTYPVNGTNADDFINVGGQDVTINAGAGNDFILNDAYVANKYFLINADVGNDTIDNIGAYATINAGAGDDYIKNSGYNTVINAGFGNDTIVATSHNNLFSYASGDGNDIIYGYNSTDTIDIVSGKIDSSIKSGQDIILNIASGSITLKDIVDEKINIHTQNPDINRVINYTSGRVTIKDYDGSKGDVIKLVKGSIKNYKVSGKDVIFTIGKSTLTVKNGKNQKITFLKADNSIDTVNSKIYRSSYEKIVTDEDSSTVDISTDKKIILIDASTDERTSTADLTLIGNAKANTIKGGSGNNTIAGGKGNDKLYGGSGSNTFIYNKGDGFDVIYNFNAETDTIQLGSNAVLNSSTMNKKGDLTFKIGSGKLTVKNVKDKKLTITSTDGSTSKQVYGGTSITIADSDGSVISVAANSRVKVIDASNRTEDIYLTGNRLNNSIIGGSGDDTIASGAGNDTLTGNGGSNLFIYSGGKDVITDYRSTDKISIAKGKIKKTTFKGDDVLFTIGNGSLRVKDGKNKSITIDDTILNFESKFMEFVGKDNLMADNDNILLDGKQILSSSPNQSSSYGDRFLREETGGKIF